MSFNSIQFFVFLSILFLFYWYLNNKKHQNLLLLFASYYFYSCWDYRFLFLLIFSTFLDYYIGIKIEKGKNKKKWFWLCITINLGLLGLLKYYNFFTESFVNVANDIGLNIHPYLLTIILPVGISFYTFHGLSYIIDINNNRIKAERDFIDYSLFVSFFPLLVAGPIERATHLLPQIKKSKFFSYQYSVDGLRQILWGLFKKVVIADQCAKLTNIAFEPSSDYSGSTYFLGIFYFTVQIYCDFSGYSDIALGTARLFGIELLKNFSFPYFSRDIAEFWRRWHISLSSWFKDYLYIPLGGSRGNQWYVIRNTFVIFLVSGLWHGANWTFIIWGGLNALYIMPSIIFKTNRNNLSIVAEGKYFPSIKDFSSIVLTFCLTMFAWIFFRAENIQDAINYIQKLFSISIFSKPQIDTKLIFVILLFFIIEWVGRDQPYAISKLLLNKHIYIRWMFYMVISIFILLYFMKGGEEQFIYFQF
jgi:alginate O-acetyltransferase complex protein AlgI